MRHTPGLSCYGAFRRQETTCSRHVVLRKCILTTFCTEKLHVKGTLQGGDEVFRRVAMRNDKLRDALQRRWHPFDVFAARRQYGHNALTSE